MMITTFKTVNELNAAGAAFMLKHLTGRHKLLCPATGSSATGIYSEFVRVIADPIDIRVIKLDEWAGLPMNHHGSCEYYLQEHLLKPLRIKSNSYISFNSEANGPKAECQRIAAELEAKGPIDLCVLGLGLNGHVAFNEPAEALEPKAHLATLSKTSMAHQMVQDTAEKPTHGYTLGLADILKSGAILLVVHGRHKRQIFQRLATGKISTQLPASFLWLHKNAHCYYCED